jgi:MFS family permease
MPSRTPRRTSRLDGRFGYDGAVPLDAIVERPSHQRWMTLGVLTFARTAMGYQFQSVGALSPLLMPHLHLAHAELGVLVGLFSLPGVLLALPGGMLGSRFGDRRVVVIGLLLMTAGSAVIGIAPTLVVASLGRLVTAVGAVLLNVLLTKMVADWFASREIIWAMALLINAWPVGIGLALFTLPAVATRWGVAMAFHVAAATAATGAMAMVLFYRAPPMAPEKRAAPAVLSRHEMTLVSIAAQPWMLYNAGYVIMLSFVPTLLAREGLTVKQAGILLGVTTVLIIASVQAGGALAQWCTRAPAMVTLGTIAFTGGLLLLPYTPPGPTLIVAGLLAGLPAGVLISAPASVLRPESRAPGMGLFYTWYYAGMTGLPIVAGWMQDLFGGAAALQCAAVAVFMILPCYGWFRIRAASAGNVAEARTAPAR